MSGTDSVVVITPTGGRPQAFALCEQFMRQQLPLPFPMRWVVVDDGPAPTPCTMGQEYLRPTPLWAPGQNTQARNLEAAIQYVAGHEGIVVIWEDDDFYGPEWLRTCHARLERADITAERNTRYWNARTRNYRVFANLFHGSLCQTAMRADVLPVLLRVCQSNHQFIDVKLWRMVESLNLRRNLVTAAPAGGCVGIKGLPGRPGIGVGHQGAGLGWRLDHNMEILRSWIGSDADLYRGYYENGNRTANLSVEGADSVSVS